ncbi:ComEA family DNA-binding protein [Dehalobacterium formicoaceticum]|uniref:ComEA family DNA-binding protein n=1 Tax=Dehalobacterium formicoaceticum TaxID=51515 RepID=A0ABT1Y266_9FIRM|nr:ComEA family DNA-binding protein [Dehalobacterium formicoaceticum]MCR6544956.1 ComEA family DNA-binding protein [Dehalobacterium formicoaceticum]
MFSQVNKQYLIIFALMLSLIFGGGVKYGQYLEQKTPPPVAISVASKIDSEDAEQEMPDAKEKPSQDLMIHVTGAVLKPGVYTLPEGSRVIDAVQLAGLDQDANLDQINLAKKITDQEMIQVPGEDSSSEIIGGAQGSVGNSNIPAANSQMGGLININTADQGQLETLPGIGPAKAAAIIQYREEAGSFKSQEDIQNVSGIGPATYNKLKDQITI